MQSKLPGLAAAVTQAPTLRSSERLVPLQASSTVFHRCAAAFKQPVTDCTSITSSAMAVVRPALSVNLNKDVSRLRK